MNELTDAMLRELVDKVEVHAATGGRGRYCQQQIDVHLSFIGYYQPPGPVISEEERRATIDAVAKDKQIAKGRRSREVQKLKRAELKEAAKTDPEASERYDQILERQRKANQKHRAKEKEERESDPAYQAKNIRQKKRRSKDSMS